MLVHAGLLIGTLHDILPFKDSLFVRWAKLSPIYFTCILENRKPCIRNLQPTGTTFTDIRRFCLPCHLLSPLVRVFTGPNCHPYTSHVYLKTENHALGIYSLQGQHLLTSEGFVYLAIYYLPFNLLQRSLEVIYIVSIPNTVIA